MNSKSKLIKIVVEVARLLVGITFTFSGFVKAVDPLGFTYKIQDYLINLNLTELFSLALPLAIFMVVAEFMLGVMLLLGVYRKWVTIFIGVFMMFFTPLTLWIAIANPVADCGCFGDALIISNWQTFYKNIVLTICTVLLIVFWRKITPLYSRKMAVWAVSFVALFGTSFALYNVCKLPVFDFRPYKIGNNIAEQMTVDPDKADVFENVFIYSKNGVEQEFTEDNYPWDDSTWVFVDMKSRLVKAGEKPKIEDFQISSFYNVVSLDEVKVWSDDITEQILSDTNYIFLMISYSLETMNEKHLTDFKNIAHYAQERGYEFYCVTSSSSDIINEWSEKNDINFHFALADERVLKTIIRSNPGLVLLQNGTVVNKWDDSCVPTGEELSNSIENSSFSKIKNTKKNNTLKLSVIFLAFIFPLGVLKLIDKKEL